MRATEKAFPASKVILRWFRLSTSPESRHCEPHGGERGSGYQWVGSIATVHVGFLLELHCTSVSLCETSHGLTPREKVRFITMGGRSKLVKAARSVSAAARAASSRRRARAAGASRALPPLDQSRPPTMGALRRKSGGTRFRSNEWGEPRSTRGSSATAAPACWEHVPRTHSHAPHTQ